MSAKKQLLIGTLIKRSLEALSIKTRKMIKTIGIRKINFYVFPSWKISLQIVNITNRFLSTQKDTINIISVILITAQNFANKWCHVSFMNIKAATGFNLHGVYFS